MLRLSGAANFFWTSWVNSRFRFLRGARLRSTSANLTSDSETWRGNRRCRMARMASGVRRYLARTSPAATRCPDLTRSAVITPLNGRSTWRLREENSLPLKIISTSGDGGGGWADTSAWLRAGAGPGAMRTKTKARSPPQVRRDLILPGTLIHITMAQISGNIAQLQDCRMVIHGLGDRGFFSLHHRLLSF